MEFDAVILGERQVTARFEELPTEIRELLHERILILIQELEAAVQSAAPVKSGELRGSIKSSIRDYPQKIVGRVFSNLPYAGVIEFGIHKAETVHGHERRLAQVFGHDVAPEEIFIDPYTRMANVEAHLFMRAGFASQEDHITQELRSVIDGVSQAESGGL